MALTREQLSALEPPDGWIWDVRPGLRTVGSLIVDPNQALINTDGYKTRLIRLAQWAAQNELGVKFDALGNGAYKSVRVSPTSEYGASVYVAIRWKVWANKPEYTRGTFGEYDCPCGRIRVSIGRVYLRNCCGPMQCTACGVAGPMMHNTGNVGRYRCSSCSDKCKQEGCTKRVPKAGDIPGSDGKCEDHTETIICRLCDHRKPREGSRELTPEIFPAIRGAKGKACADCFKRFTCDNCKLFVPNANVRDGKCDICRDKEADAERVKAETWEKDELPRHGSMFIPSLPSRPFRTISIETEVDGDGAYIARTLYRCGLVPIPRVAAYTSHPDTKEGDYIAFLKHDGSVTGGELIAFLMNLDDEKHAAGLLDLLAKVHSMHKLGKVQHNANCGGHIHVDAHNFGYGSVWRLLTGFGYAEDPIYRIAGAGCSYGHRTLDPTHDRANGGRGYAKSPVKGPFGSKGHVGRQIAVQDRMCGLNFQPFLQAVNNCACGAWAYEDSRKCKCNLGKATIEWRVFNSTHNPRILHAWVALIQAMHAWADEEIDPTPEWEERFPALAWRTQPFKAVAESHVAETKKRLEWMHTELPFTDDERDSLCYAISVSDMGPRLGKEYIESLKALPNVADYERPKAARNPARRKRVIKIEAPTPGKEGPFIGRDSAVVANPFVRAERLRGYR
jgi:hypothetical protein